MTNHLNVMFDHQIVVDQVFGGISRYFVSMAPELEDYGVKAKFAAPLYLNSQLSSLPSRYVFGRHIRASRITRLIARKAAVASIPMLAQFTKPDIFHETYYMSRRLAPARVPVVLTVYDMIHELYPQYYPNDPTARHKSAAIARADLIICISANTRDDLIRCYPEASSKSVVILLGFDSVFGRSTGHSRDRPYLLFVGLRGGYNNFAGLLEAYAASSALRRDLDVMCVGGGEFSADEIAAIEAAGCAGRIHQRSATDVQLAEFYSGAAAFVYPSLYEGFGIPPLEAMAAGCPVITTNASSIPEVCGDAAHYAQAESSESLRHAIETVVRSQSISKALVHKGYARIREFSWARCAMETANIYRTLT